VVSSSLALANLRAGSRCQCALILAGHCAGRQRSQLSEGATYRIALCCLALSFVPPGPRTEKKAVAMVERTKEDDSISCVLMKEELSPLPSAA